jgi:hypothetical protein
MAANESPIFTLYPVIGSVKISTANANRDGTGTLGTVLTGAAGSGTKVASITIKAEVITTAGMVRLFIDNGVTVHLIYEQVITAVPASATVAAFYINIPFNDLVVPDGYILKAGTEKAEQFSITAFGGKYE